MSDEQDYLKGLYLGLSALAETGFPKKCANCGREFATSEQYILETQEIRANHSGLKASEDDDGKPIVELFRNCPCGSTLLGFFGDRRDMSEAGQVRRKRFGELLDYLTSAGLDPGVARTELLKAMRGEGSEILEKYRPSKK